MTDLTAEALGPLLGARPVRAYTAILSSGAEAMAWARRGAPDGAVVVADYQASPRGRAGLQWSVRAGEGLCFSVVLRPGLPAEREGWLYAVAVCALADVAGEGAWIEWPDAVVRRGERFAAVGVHAELGPHGVDWAVVNVLVPGARPPRGPLLRRALEAFETRYRMPEEEVLDAYASRCATLGRRVVARLIPLAPGGPKVAGRATAVKADGALVIETVAGTHVAVRAPNLGLLEDEESETRQAAIPEFARGYLDRETPRRPQREEPGGP